MDVRTADCIRDSSNVKSGQGMEAGRSTGLIFGNLLYGSRWSKWNAGKTIDGRNVCYEQMTHARNAINHETKRTGSMYDLRRPLTFNRDNRCTTRVMSSLSANNSS